MITKDKLFDILEIFSHCVNLPIKAVNLNGETLGTAGYSPCSYDIFVSNKIFEIAKTHFNNNIFKKDIATFTCAYNISFSACYISSSEYIEDTIYILGPYLNSPIEYKGLSYKQKKCIPHMFSLLENISKQYSNINKYNPYINKAIDYINNHYSESFSINNIANYLNINKCYFSSLFRKETGQTFSEYLNVVRVEKSKDLLLNNKNLSILDVAVAVGFNNQSYYNTIFKKLNNKTPLEVRNLSL